MSLSMNHSVQILQCFKAPISQFPSFQIYISISVHVYYYPFIPVSVCPHNQVSHCLSVLVSKFHSFSVSLSHIVSVPVFQGSSVQCPCVLMFLCLRASVSQSPSNSVFLIPVPSTVYPVMIHYYLLFIIEFQVLSINY